MKESNPLNIKQIEVGKVGKLLVWATLGVPRKLSLEQTIRKALNDGLGVFTLISAAGEISKNSPLAFIAIITYALTRILNWHLKEEVEPD